jgi:hypothetical protein
VGYSYSRLEHETLCTTGCYLIPQTNTTTSPINFETSIYLLLPFNLDGRVHVMNRGADGRVHFMEESILYSGIPQMGESTFWKSPFVFKVTQMEESTEKNFGS